MKDIFVKKEGLLEEKFVKILERTINIRKDIEHGVKKDLSGKELDELLSDAEKFLKRIKRLFTQIEKIKEEEDMVNVYESIVTIIRDVLRMEGIEKVEDEQVRKDAGNLIKFLVEYIQRKRGRELERAKIRVKHGERYGEIILLEDTAFIIHDIDHEEKELSKAKINPDGSLGTIQKSSLEELEKALTKVQIPPKVFIKEPIFEDLKRVFGKDVEVLVNY